MSGVKDCSFNDISYLQQYIISIESQSFAPF